LEGERETGMTLLAELFERGKGKGQLIHQKENFFGRRQSEQKERGGGSEKRKGD